MARYSILLLMSLLSGPVMSSSSVRLVLMVFVSVVRGWVAMLGLIEGMRGGFNGHYTTVGTVRRSSSGSAVLMRRDDGGNG